MIATGCASRAVLQQILADQIDSTSARAWENHLAHCAQCRATLDSLAASDDEWREFGRQLSSCELEPVPADSSDSVDMLGELGQKEARSEASNSDWHRILVPPSHPELLGRIGRYEVEKLIGQGGFGVVFKAQDTELNRPVAIKVLAPHLAHHGAARKRFAREAQAAAAINHPNVVPIHAVDADAEYPYLVMTYVPGHSLQEVVERNGPLDVKTIVRIGCQVAAGLDAAHRQGLVHRDIKPANILLENDLQRALITDFGLARAADDAAMTRSGWLAGTPHYMSPEQAQGLDIDARSDLFSLGSVLYFLATGREPFRAGQPLGVLQKIIKERLLPVRSLNADIPLPLSKFIELLMEKRPGNRIPSARETNQWLENYLAYLQRPQDYRQPRVQRPRRTTRWAVQGLGAIIVLLALAIGWRSWLGQPAREGLPMENLAVNDHLPEFGQWFAADHDENWAWIQIHQEIRDLANDVGFLEMENNQYGIVPNPSDYNWQVDMQQLEQCLIDIERLWETIDSGEASQGIKKSLDR